MAAMMGLPEEFGGRFVRKKIIAERSNCTVYRAIDKELGDREVALKIFALRPQGSAEYIERYQKELSVLRTASHPSLVPIIMGGVQDDWFYMAMELIEGPNLRDFLKNRGEPVGGVASAELIADLCSGLKELHELQGHHGHLDSRAILFTGEDARIAGYTPHVLSDIQKSLTTAGQFLVDPAYVAPEQVSGTGQIDHRADIYSLSVILYEMITGNRPFIGTNPLQVAMQRLGPLPESPRKKVPDLSPLLDAAIMKGLAKDPKERFQSAMEFADAITAGRRANKNPLVAAMEQQAGGGELMMEGGTIPVAMSAEAIQAMMQRAEQAKKNAAPPGGAEDVVATAQMRRSDLGVVGGGDPNKTGMGMKAQNEGAASGSLLITSGELRGRRFLLDQPQVIIGSDPTCGVALRGKGIPPRYALVLKRGADYSVAPLGGGKIVMNGGPQPDGEETPLKRGDTLTVGPHELRFVAPGEVFTLKSDVADRVVDRPPNRAPKILAAIATLLVVTCCGVLYLYKQSVADAEAKAKRDIAARQKKKTETIEQLRREGDDFFRLGKLIEPVEANARKRFEQIRELEPDDAYAKRRLEDIDAAVKRMLDEEARKKQFAGRITELLANADRYFQEGKYVSPPGANAKDTYNEVIKLDANNDTAKNRLVEINKILGDFVGRISELVTKAQGLIEARQYTAPAGDNAFEIVKQIQNMDPSNADARGLLLEIAARTILEGDAAKAQKNTDGMKQAYNSAKLVGVDPDYILEKLQGMDTIKKATSAVVIIGRDESKQNNEKNSKYITKSQLDQKISELELSGFDPSGGKDQRVYQIRQKRGK